MALRGSRIENFNELWFLGALGGYSMFPIKRTVFFTSVTVHKNTVRLIGNTE